MLNFIDLLPAAFLKLLKLILAAIGQLIQQIDDIIFSLQSLTEQ